MAAVQYLYNTCISPGVYHFPVTGSQVRLTTLLPTFDHSALSSGPVDLKQSANER
jgi:hypothetical protein